MLAANRNIIGIAATGSGKTLAFVLPGLSHIAAKGLVGSRKPSMLVLAPTRELAMQTDKCCQQFRASCGVKSLCVYGACAPRPPLSASLKSCTIH